MTRSSRVAVTQVEGGVARRHVDAVAVEEPLELRVESAQGAVPLAVTMRTPGDDLELAAGFLLAEGVVRTASDIVSIRHCRQLPPDRRDNTVSIRLASDFTVATSALARHFTVTSACGVCGVESLDALAARAVEPVVPTAVRADVLVDLPGRLRAAQRTFDRTGGLHAAALFSPEDELLCVREDVGRHNALDKVIGWALMRDLLPLSGCTIMLSGRLSFELVQKCVVAGAGVLAGVSAPSSLAVTLAERFGVTLVGFVRGQRFVLYTGQLADDALSITRG